VRYLILVRAICFKFKGANIVAVVTEEVDRKEIIRLMEPRLLNIALPKRIVVMEELPMMGTGKVDFRTVTHRVANQATVA